MRFGSICSGIEAASVAWNPLGWEAAWFAEVDIAASGVLAHRFGATAPVHPLPGSEAKIKRIQWGDQITNWGDMTKLPEAVRSGAAEAPDVLCGGTPCQSYSIAGRREGLSDDRGQLTLTFVELADAIDERRAARGEQPCVVFWENVPGVLSSKDNAFGCFLADLAGEDVPLEPAGKRWTNAGVVLGPKRAVAWRVLDSQYAGLAQRRQRVFVVASAREGFDPAAVLFEFEGVRRDSAPSRETGQDVAGTLAARTDGGGFPGTDEACSGYDQPVEPSGVIAMAHGQGGAEISEERCPTLTCNHEAPIAFVQNTRDEVRLMGGDGQIVGALAAQTGMKQQCYLAIPILEAGARTGVSTTDVRAGIGIGIGIGSDGDPMFTLQAGKQHGVALSVALRGREGGATAELGDDVAGTLRASGGGGDKAHVLCDHGTQDPIIGVEHAHALGRNSGQENAVCVTGEITHTLRAEGFDASEDGTGRGQPIVPCNFQSSQSGVRLNDTAGTLDANYGPRRHNGVLGVDMAVRRLMPIECERLQGFPDGWTEVPVGNKPAADGPRYKQLGNSWAVPCVRWIGERIATHVAELGADIGKPTSEEQDPFLTWLLAA